MAFRNLAFWELPFGVWLFGNLCLGVCCLGFALGDSLFRLCVLEFAFWQLHFWSRLLGVCFLEFVVLGINFLDFAVWGLVFWGICF